MVEWLPLFLAVIAALVGIGVLYYLIRYSGD